MIDKNLVVEQIREAFEACEFPGEAFLQGSKEGCEPYEVVAPFRGIDVWQAVDSALLDANAEALSFLSEGGFRFFIPAYLIADLHGELERADPLFHLTHGFRDSSVKLPTATGAFEKKIGKSALLNPRRFGAMTSNDYARFRLSVFTREEAGAIATYLQYKREFDSENLYDQDIDAALEEFWLDRAGSAPRKENLTQHLEAEESYLKEIYSDDES